MPYARRAQKHATPSGGGLPPISNGLIAYWPANEGSGNVLNELVSGNDASLVDIVWGTGRYGGACVEFESDTSSAIAGNKDITNGLGVLTLCVQQKPTLSSSSYGNWTFAQGYQSTLNHTMGGKYSTRHRPQVGTDVNNWGEMISDTPSLTVNDWTHIALTWDGATLRAFQEGIEVGTPVAITGTIRTSADDFLLCGPFEGLVPRLHSHDFRVYNRVLSASELQQIAAGTG